MQKEKLFDEKLFLAFQKRAWQKKQSDADFLLAKAGQEMVQRLSFIKRYFPCAISLHNYGSLVPRLLSETGQVGCVHQIEKASFYFTEAEKGQVCSLQALDLPKNFFQLLVSLFSLHLSNDSFSALLKIRKSLSPDGLFLAAVLGQGTLQSLRESLIAAELELYGKAHLRVVPFPSLYEAGALLQQAGFAIPVVDQDIWRFHYDNLSDILRDLRGMGMSNMLFTRSRQPVSRRFFCLAEEKLRQRSGRPDGSLEICFQVIWLLGWAPHPDQQKPLKPGTAQISFTQFL